MTPSVWREFRSFDRPSRMLMVNQFAINISFYLLMPFLAGHLAGTLAMAGWAVGLILGMRNFSQQGMFLVGGTLADRLGYKPLIVAGCLLRTAGFALLAVVDSLPALLIASAATGFAGALFNPAVRAYLAADAGERRVEAFAMFSVFYQAGMLLGPLAGIALMALNFRAAALVAAGIFAVLTIAQWRALPAQRQAVAGRGESMLADWRSVAGNRRFLLFSLAMVGSYVLSFQVYLALPLQATYLADVASPTTLTTAVFVVFGLVAVAGQLRITRWFSARWGPGRGLVIGVALFASAFVPPLLARTGVTAAVALLCSAALLAVGSAVVYPFEMDTIVALSGNRLVATHYGFYNTVVGVGILVGNFGAGAAFGSAHAAGRDALAWAGLLAVGVAATVALRTLQRSGQLVAATPTAAA